MRGLFVTTNSNTVPAAEIAHKIGTRFDKVAVQDSMPDAHELIKLLNARTVTSVWTAAPDDTTRLLNYGAHEIIIQGEDRQADATVLNVVALRTCGYTGLLSVVTNLWPSRNLHWWDTFMHRNDVRLLVECYLPDNRALTVAAMTGEGRRRGYPGCEPVLGCYRGYTLDSYRPLPGRYWIWDLADAAIG